MKVLRHRSVAQPSLAAGSPGIPARCSKDFPPRVEQGCSPHPQAGKPALHRQRGIALVVTLILLSVVTFLAVAFLFLARRERGSVGTTLDLTAARRATEAATEHAKVAVIASLIQSNNQFNYDLLVSTNFINRNGFIPSGAGFASLTNVNYDYLTTGVTNFSTDQRNQNIANLFYNPRPPVFVRPNDFRFYLDLNQSGRFDTNGLLPEFGANGRFVTTLDANGNKVVVTNFYVGDPEWVGILERPDRPHSASNKFLVRYSYIVVPSGKTLDINSLHNQSKQAVAGLNYRADGYSRNMGVGPWELNLASFFVDLNTNVWQQNVGGAGSFPTALINPSPYFYDTTPASLGLRSSTGTAFEDALALTRYRYGGDWRNLKSVTGLFGPVGSAAFQADFADGYGSGPLLLTNTTSPVDGDGPTRVNQSWPGAENPNHFFTTQDLFDRTKTTGFKQNTPNTFADRLLNAGYYGVGFYDRYTYYRLLSQLGADSTPDATVTNKLHLNYVNVDSGGHIVPDMQTNFVPWTSAAEFFTNAADRLLRATFTDTNANRIDFGVAAVPNITRIPVLISNQFVYTPAMHRVLQLAANVFDAMTNRTYGRANTVFPTVFSPVFGVTNGDVYITGFEELTEKWETYSARPLRDLDRPADVAALQPFNRVMGVPLVIGAKKGFPAFNKFALESTSQVIRKVTMHRAAPPAVDVRPVSTNQMFIVGISNAFAFEAWNSYQAPYARSMDIYVTNFVSVLFRYTNDARLDLKNGAITNAPVVPPGNAIFVPAGAWSGWKGPASSDARPTRRSFQIPLTTNYAVLPNSIYRPKANPPYFETTNLSSMNLGNVLAPLPFDSSGEFPMPELDLSISNRILFALVDHDTRRIVDYVHLSGLASKRNLIKDVGPSPVPELEEFWQTNRVTPVLKSPPRGIVNQIQESLGQRVGTAVAWDSFNLPPVQDKARAIQNFRVFCGLSGFNAVTNDAFVQTNLDMQAPYTPLRRVAENISWQVNDPLVHYTLGDVTSPYDADRLHLAKYNEPIPLLSSITNLNLRYQPWSGKPNSSTLSSSSTEPDAYSVEMKDPGVTSSDAWDFPTNKFATLGLLGRVHRGTPWQTVYLKANDVDATAWAKWTGNSNRTDATYARPVMDRVLVDVFTTAIDQNTTRGQLNVNQTGLAAWSALLGGVIGLTNSSTEADLTATPPAKNLAPFIIPPAGADPAGPTNSVLGRIYAAVNRTRASAPYNGSFKRLGDILAVPELTTASPLLNTNSTSDQFNVQLEKGINDAVYERLPQMLLGLMRGGDQPTFTIYAYGQTLHPANRSIVTSGPYFGLCTNYQITAEFATRTVVQVEGAPGAPKVVVKSFNILPPE